MRNSLWTPRSAGREISRRGALALGAGAGAALWAGRAVGQAAQNAPPPPSKPTGQVIVGLSQEPTVFNPLMPHIEVDQGVHWNLFNPLWGVAPNGNLIPQLAAEIPTVENGGISEDGLNWRIKLRPGVKWHDGEPFTADDVKFTLDLINNKNFRAWSRNGHELVGDIKVNSPTDITWRMQKAYAPYPSILSWTFIVPQHILGKAADPNTAPFNNSPVGTGPFRWSERMPGDHITLVANQHFFGTGPYLERLVFRYIPDLTVLFTQFQTGAIDYTSIQGITADHYNEAIKIPGRKVVAGPSGSVESITMNLGAPGVPGPSGAAGAVLRHGQELDHQGDLLRSAAGDRDLPAAASPGRSIPTCRSMSTIRPRRNRSSTPPAGSRDRTACGRRTDCGWRSPTRPPPATMCANRRRNCCSRCGAISASICRSRTCRRR